MPGKIERFKMDPGAPQKTWNLRSRIYEAILKFFQKISFLTFEIEAPLDEIGKFLPPP